MLQRLSATIILFLIFSDVSAQDIIVRTNNDSIRSRVVEITIDKIKFRYLNLPKGPVIEIPKNEVKEIIYENGSRLTIVYNPYEVSKDMYVHEQSHAVKFDIVAPLFNHFTIAYEFKLKKARNIEIKAGIIKPYVLKDLKYSEGFFVRGGLKFVHLTESYMKGLKYIHPLKGSYFKPEFIFGRYKRNEDNIDVTYTNYGIDILFGKQYILWNTITFDYCAGLGLGFQSYSYQSDSITDKKDVDFNYAYSHLFFGKKIPIIISAGITIGVVY